MPTADELLRMLRLGGSIASAGDCTEREVGHARLCGRLHVDAEGFGSVYRPAVRIVRGHRPHREAAQARESA